MALLPACAIAVAPSSTAPPPALLSLPSASAKFDDCSFRSFRRAKFRPRHSLLAHSQGLGRQGYVRRRVLVRSSGDSDGDGENESSESKGEIKEGKEASASNSGRVDVEISPSVMKQLEAVTKKDASGKSGGLTMTGLMEILEEVVKSGGGEKSSSSSLNLIEQNMKKRRERFERDEKSKSAVPLSFDSEARNDENRFDGAYFARLEDLGDEPLEINTLDDFYPAFIILMTDALLELGDLMKMLGDGEFFSTQAMLRASPIPKTASTLKTFPEDIQLRRSLDNILVYVQSLGFYISSMFTGPDGFSLNTDESLATEADLLYNMYYKYKHKETLTVPLDETELLEQAVTSHGFEPSGKAVKCRQGLIFPGNWNTTPSLARQAMQKVLDAKFEGLVAILLDRVPETNTSGVLIAHKHELLSFTFAEKGDVLLASGLGFGVVLGALQFANADVAFDEVNFQGALVPLGLVGVTAGGWLARKAVAALYNVSHMVRLPFSLPVPHLGSFSSVVFYKGCLPERTSLLDLSLSSTLASLAISGALIGASFTQGENSTAVADFQGLLLVPEQLFRYSSAFTWLLHKLSIATLSGEMGEDLNLVLSPLALAGVLGLHSSALGLLPVGILDGGRIVTAIFGRDVQHVVTSVVFFLMAVSLAVNEPWLALAWVVGTTPALMDDWFQIDEATQPSFIRKALGLAMVVAAVGAFIPTLS